MGKRRTFSPEFKLETVLDLLRGEKSVAQLCRERDITESLLYKWRDAFLERAPGVFVDQRRTSTTRKRSAWPNWSDWSDGRRWRSRC
jgi:transposase-like protein